MFDPLYALHNCLRVADLFLTQLDGTSSDRVHWIVTGTDVDLFGETGSQAGEESAGGDHQQKLNGSARKIAGKAE